MEKTAIDFVLVAGGAGFIGTNLCERLMRDGEDVIVVDDLSSGTHENIYFLENISNETRRAFVFIKWDLHDPQVFSKLDNYCIKEIYNLACPASPKFYQHNPFQTLFTNIWGTWNMIRLATMHNCRMLLTSTSEVYGDPSVSPQSEEYRGNTSCYGPRACYDEGKRVAETFMYEADKMFPGQFKVVRIFNTYGPHMRKDDGRFISNFICQTINEDKLTIYGDGSQTRSICYVDDTVDGLIKMMKSEQSGPINIGNPTEKSVIEWAFLIYKITMAEMKKEGAPLIKYLPLPQDDPLQRKPDITKAKQLLGWEPKKDPKEGITQTVKYFLSI